MSGGLTVSAPYIHLCSRRRCAARPARRARSPCGCAHKRRNGRGWAAPRSLVAGARARLEQRGDGHDEAGLAIAAHRHLLGEPRLLHRVRAVARQALDGRHRRAFERRAIATLQLVAARPSTITVQAPQSRLSQPYLVPVRLDASRSAHSKGVSGSSRYWTASPLTVIRVMRRG